MMFNIGSHVQRFNILTLIHHNLIENYVHHTPELGVAISNSGFILFHIILIQSLRSSVSETACCCLIIF